MTQFDQFSHAYNDVYLVSYGACNEGVHDDNHLTQVSGQGIGYNLNEVFFDKGEKGVIRMLILSGERKLKW